MTSSKHPRVIFIGIAGPSGCGKTTYAKHLVDRLQSPLHLIELDHFFFRRVTINHPILGRIDSEEEPGTLQVEHLLNLVRQIKTNPEKLTRYHRDNVSINNNKPIIVIIEGFLLFALSDELTNMFDIRIFFESTKEQCRMRRYRRQYRISETTPDDQIKIADKFQQWFDHLVWDSYLQRRNLQISKSNQIFQSEEYQNKQYTQIDNYIDKCLKNVINQK